MTASRTTTGPFISFARGAPSLDIVDVAGLKAAVVRALERDPAAATGYGPATGYPPLRAWIAARHGVEVDQVLITNGSLQADSFLFQHLVNAGDDVVVERPTYDRTLLALRTMGAKIHQVSLDGGGLDVDELRTLVDTGVRPKIVHVIPNFQNPAGVTLSPGRRQGLIELAREHRFTVFEDDPYAEIRFPGRGETPPALFTIASAAAGFDEAIPLVVRASSFTKTICPGIRVGYLIGPASVIADIAAQAANVYISPNMFAEAAVYQFCISGDIDRSIVTVRSVLAERASALASAVRREIPDASFREPDGGYFLWVDLAKDVDADRLTPAAAARGVAVVPGTNFVLDGGRHSLRLAYSAVPTDQIDEGVQRLAAAIADVRRG